MAKEAAMAGDAAMARRAPPSLRALRFFWLAVLLVGAGTAGTLGVLGPPARAPAEPEQLAAVSGTEETLAVVAPEVPQPPQAAAASAMPVLAAPVKAAPALLLTGSPPLPLSAGPAPLSAAPSPMQAALPPVPGVPTPRPAAPLPAFAGRLPPPAAALPGPVEPAIATPAASSPSASGGAPAGLGQEIPLGTPLGSPALDRAIPRAEPAMLESGAHGPLPRIAADGRFPMQVYARPFDASERRPRIGLVLGGLGSSAKLAEEAISRLPPSVTLAFSPYATQAELLRDRARVRGMEILLALPLEPTGYPLNSPGNRALLSGLAAAENADRLDWALSRFTGYVGAIGALGAMRGERYAAGSERLDSLQDSLQRRGLLYVDPRPGANRPARAWGVTVDVVVDEPPNRLGIDQGLAALEALARERGSALGYAGEATPVLLDRLAAWAGSLESRGSVLAPVSFLSRRPDATAARR